MAQQIYNSDFSDIKASIIDFFKEDETFNSYNFLGNAISNVMDIFSFIEQNATFYLNNTANEFFITEAVQTKNIYKNAKKLNYFPVRKSAGYIEVEFVSTIDMTVPIFSEFTLGSFKMYLFENVTLDTSNSRTATVKLYEGTLLTENFIVNTVDLFTATVETTYSDVDNDYVYVYLDTPDGGGGFIDGPLWINSDNEIIETNTNSYFTAFTDTTYSVQFDNGRIFNIPNVGDRARVIYLKTTGTTPNGTGGTVSTTIANLTVDASTNVIVNGTNEESLAAIKVRAPLFYSSQNRGVTERDWNVLIKRYSKYDIFKDTLMWGGEKENVSALFGPDIVETPTTYQNLGYVIVTAIKTDYAFLTTTESNELLAFLEDFKIAGLRLRYLPSNIYTIKPTVSIKTNPSLSFSQTEFETTINTYLTNLEGFNKEFYKSKLTKLINEQSSIVYSDVSFTYTIKVLNEAHKAIRIGTPVTSNTVNATISGKTFEDDGAGNIEYDSSVVGTINYTTGFITLNSLISALGEYEFSFGLNSDLSNVAIRESIFKFDDIVVVNL